MRGLKTTLPLLLAAVLLAGAGTASAIDVSGTVDGSATVDAAARPTRGPAISLTPDVPPPAEVPEGALGDPSIPDSMALPANSGEGRRVVYSKVLMRVWAVDEYGQVVKTHRVSGKVGVPYPGTYYVFSRSYSTFAVHNPSIVWNYMVRFAHTPNGGNVGFHEIPTQCGGGSCWQMQTEAQLGQALSGGCVRQSEADAIWMWNWAQLGTKVVVID